MKASALLLLLLPFTSNAAAPTAPDEADAGSIDVANRIRELDLEDSDRLQDIGQRLSTADATSGLEKGGKDER